MYKKILLAAVAAGLIAMTGSSIASADTSVPTLPAGVDPAFISDNMGTPEAGTFTLTGTLVLTGGVTVTCNYHVQIAFRVGGTSDVAAFQASNCTLAGFSNCTPTVTPTNLTWGSRFAYDTGAAAFKHYVNAHADMTFSQPLPTCPINGTFTVAGTLSPTIDINAGVLTMTFGAGSGALTGVLGSFQVTGTLTSDNGIGANTGLGYYP